MTRFALGAIDYIAVGAFIALLCAIGYIAGRGERRSLNDYFLAGNSLPWYAVGGSLVAAVVSTEHFVGMVGWTVIFGASIGMWTWALFTDITLLIFLWVPFLLASRVFTIPQFLEQRFNKQIRLVFAVVTIVLSVVNFMAAVLYTGGLALEQLFDLDITLSIAVLGGIAGVWAIYGGLSSVAWTDVFTLVVILLGGVMVVVLGLHALSPDSLVDGARIMLERNRAETGVWAEAAARHQHLFTEAPSYNRLSVIQPADHLAAPTLGMILSSFSVGIWYNAMNQFVIQRVLAAKDAYHARMGIVFSGIVYIFVPLLIVVPGLILFALHPQILLNDWNEVQAAADRSYIELIQEVMPMGLRGIFLAALFGAVYSTVNSVLNSAATIFTIDIYRERINTTASDKDLVRIGVISSTIILLVAVTIAVLIHHLQMSIFYYMQTLNSFIAAPFAAIFMLGVLWRRMNARGAAAALSAGFVAAIALKFAPDLIAAGYPRWATTILNQAGLTLLVSLFAGVAGSLLSAPPKAEQITDALTFSWSNPHLRAGFGHRLRSNVVVWWLILILMTAAVMAYFSPVVFP